MPDITFFPKSADKSGFVRIYMFVSIDNVPGWYPTKVKCLADSWDKSKQKIKSSQIDYKKLNGHLTARKGDLQKVFDDLTIQRTPATVDLVRQRYNAELTGTAIARKKDYTFLEFYDIWVKERNVYRAKSYMRLFKQTRFHVCAINPNPRFSDINMEFYYSLIEYFIDECEIENNTVFGNVKRIKTVMGSAIIDPRTKHQDIPLDYKLFEDMYVKPKVVWIDWETELICLETFEPLPEDKPLLEFFLFCCYTGLRHSDVFKLTPENFIRKKGEVFLDHTIIKTKLDHNIQLSPKAVEVLKRWHFRVPKIYQHDLNEGIKRLAKAAAEKWEKVTGSESLLLKLVEKVRYSGSERKVTILPKYELITTHTARRAFGRRWAERGGDLRLLQLYYGHAELQQTLDYIGWSTSEANKEMLRVMQ